MPGYFTDTTNLAFCTAQVAASAMAVTTGTISTNVIDCQASPTLRDLGINPMFVDVIVTEAFTPVGDGAAEFTSLNIKLYSDSTVNLATSATQHVSRDIALAALTLGARFTLALPPGQTYERYLGLWFTSTAEAASAGKIAAYLTPALESRQFFADGSSIA